MEKNKKILVLFAFIICLSSLAWFVSNTLSDKKTTAKKTKFEFDVPKIKPKKEKPLSKFEYYTNQIDQENIEKGFLLKKEDSIERALEATQQEKFYKKEDFEETPLNTYKKKAAINSSPNQELRRLLNMMESKSNYLNNIGNEQGVLNKLTNKDPLATKNKFKDLVENLLPEKDENSKKEDSVAPKVIFRKTTNSEEPTAAVFFGVTKNKKAFMGVVSDSKSTKKQLFKAEIYTTQVLGNGGLVIINLLEDLVFNEDYLIPNSSVLYGTVRFSPSRMFISISPNVYKNDKRLLNEVVVYDFDGLEGVFTETNLLGSIPVETAQELTELVRNSYKNANPIFGSSAAVPLKEATIIIGSEKILKYLNRIKLKIEAGYKIWISLDNET